MGKVWMFKFTKRRVWSHYNKPSNKPRIENKEKNKEYALKTKTEQCCKHSVNRASAGPQQSIARVQVGPTLINTQTKPNQISKRAKQR